VGFASETSGDVNTAFDEGTRLSRDGHFLFFQSSGPAVSEENLGFIS